MNFGEDIENRIPNIHVNIEAGLKEHRLYHLKKTFEQKELTGIIALQITDLQEFLNVKSNMSAKQVFDTAELIVEEHEFMSFTLIQDCFNKIKKAEKPFDGSMYGSLDGRKIMEALQKYDNVVDEEIFGYALIAHKAKLRSDMENPEQLRKMHKLINKSAK